MTATLSRASRIVRRFRRTWAEMDYAQRRMIEIRTGVPQAGGPSRVTVDELERLYRHRSA